MSTEIRLTRVMVDKLFGRFTYDINFENGYDVSILIAPNGCGKTTIFNLIDFIFNPTVKSYRSIYNVPFNKCECTLSNGKVVTLKKASKRVNRKRRRSQVKNSFDFILDKYEDEVEEVNNKRLLLTIEGSEEAIDMTKLIERFQDGPRADVPIDYLDIDFSSFTSTELKYIFKNLPPRYRRYLAKEWTCFADARIALSENDCDININYITANRLQNVSLDIPVTKRNASMHDGQRSIFDSNPLQTIQDQTVVLLKGITDEYNALQREMKDRLPRLYLEKKDVTMDFNSFKKQWEKYIADIEKYREIGLITTDEEAIIEMDELERAFYEKGSFLEVYLEAFQNTLRPFETEYDRLKLFVDILNRRNRVTRKELLYGENGLRIVVDGKDLSLDCLSSGEKNDLIMFYKLIFSSEQGGLVLIDEPEISLHIEWQEEYLDRLLEICEMNRLQAVVATHSPNIVNGHFELYADRGFSDVRS